MKRFPVSFIFGIGAVFLAAPFVWAKGAGNLHPTSGAEQADIVFLGEQHDNPVHHEVQAAWVAALSPTAIVFEMLTETQAARVTPDIRGDMEALEAALGWEAAGWPDFTMYHPIFTAASQAQVLGAAVPREAAREVMEAGPEVVFGAEDTERYGLNNPLPEAQQAMRIAFQAAAHCDAMPEALLPRMVDIQRLRDASLARAALDALQMHGAPVVVITGNGHAREDWGAPFFVRQVAPEVTVFALGQGEGGRMPEGTFDSVLDGPVIDRADPCEAFR